MAAPGPADDEAFPSGSWEEAAVLLEREARQESVDRSSRDLFYAIGRSDRDGAALAIALGADVNQCVAYTDARRRDCASRMLDYAVQMHRPEEQEDGGQASLAVVRVLLRHGALLVDDDIIRLRRNPLSVRKLFPRGALLLLFLESGYAVTPDLLALACQYHSSAPDRSSYPLQTLLKAGPYNQYSTFRGKDFGSVVRRDIIRHVHGMDNLERPLDSVTGLDGISLLHLAAVSGNTEVASCLIRSGVDLGAPTSAGATAMEIAWSLWVYTWSDAVWGADYVLDQPAFLDFIRLLLLHGVSPGDILRDYARRPGVYEAIFVRQCREYRLEPPVASEAMSLEELFERHFTGGRWSLEHFNVLDDSAAHLCTIVVRYEGVRLSDHSRMSIPLVYLDNMLYIAGSDVKEVRFPTYRNGRRMSLSAVGRFWESLGLDVGAVPDPAAPGMTP